MLPGVSRTNCRQYSVDVAREVDWQHHRFQVPAAVVVVVAVAVATAETEFVVDIGLVRLVEAALVVALAAAVAAAAAGFA